MRLRELRQSNRQVFVRARVIHSPASAIAIGGGTYSEPAKREGAGERVGCWTPDAVRAHAAALRGQRGNRRKQ
jgi:hypothetical protein